MGSTSIWMPLFCAFINTIPFGKWDLDSDALIEIEQRAFDHGHPSLDSGEPNNKHQPSCSSSASSSLYADMNNKCVPIGHAASYLAESLPRSGPLTTGGKKALIEWCVSRMTKKSPTPINQTCCTHKLAEGLKPLASCLAEDTAVASMDGLRPQYSPHPRLLVGQVAGNGDRYSILYRNKKTASHLFHFHRALSVSLLCVHREYRHT
mgnify:FL=1